MSTPVEELQDRFGGALSPLAWAYSRIMRIRAALFRRGIFKAWRAPAITVSVGNIGWGGTGKTPLVDWLLRWSEDRKIQAAVLTRGYRAKPRKYPHHVGPGGLAEECGDEPLMLARNHPDARIVIDPVRSRGGKWLFEHYKPRLVVLDDGFQHMAVERDVNLVLLRPSDLAQRWNKVIPSGPWREDFSAFKRADCFLMKLDPDHFHRVEPIFRARLGDLRVPFFTFSIVPRSLVNVLSGEKMPDLGGEPYLLISGVGEPKQVQRTAKDFIGYRPVDHIAFKDHHMYRKTDALRISSIAKAKGAKFVLCTPKDAVKLGPMCTTEFVTFDLDIVFGPGTGSKGSFEDWWRRRWNTLNAAAKPGKDTTQDNGEER